MVPEPTLGETLRLARFRRRLGLRTLAQQSGVSVGAIMRAERDNPTVALGNVRRVADALGLDLTLQERTPTKGDTHEPRHTHEPAEYPAGPGDGHGGGAGGG